IGRAEEHRRERCTNGSAVRPSVAAKSQSRVWEYLAPPREPPRKRPKFTRKKRPARFPAGRITHTCLIWGKWIESLPPMPAYGSGVQLCAFYSAADIPFYRHHVNANNDRDPRGAADHDDHIAVVVEGGARSRPTVAVRGVERPHAR